MREVRVRESRYAALVQQAQSTGVPVEELVNRALTKFFEYEQFINNLAEKVKQAQAGK